MEPLEDRRLLAVITVDSLDDGPVNQTDGNTTLRDALALAADVANPGADDIIFAASLGLDTMPGRIDLTEGEITIDSDVTITGPGAAQLTIDADADENGTGDSRAFALSEGVTATLDGLTIQKGYSTAGGAVFCTVNSTLWITDSTLSDNTAADGGAVYGDSGTSITISGSTLWGNAASDEGGAIHSRGAVDLVGSTLNDNEASDRGGAVYVVTVSGDATLTATNSIFTGNRALRYGGAVCAYGSATSVTAIRSTFTHNRATLYDGGAICGQSATVNVASSNFHGNRAAHYGGAIYGSALATVVNSVFAGNRADGYGGAIHAGYGLDTWNSTFAGNRADMLGGAIYGSRNSTITNSILWRNEGGDILAGNEFAGNLIEVDPQFVRDPSDGGDGWGDDLDTPGVDESLNDDFGDLRLTDVSPALDNGATAALPEDAHDLDDDGNTTEALPLDRDGKGRVFGTAVDCGAFELQAAPAPGRETPSLVVTTADPALDLFDGDISISDALYYAGSAGPGSTVSFDGSMNNATITLVGNSLWITRGITVDASALDALTIDAAQTCRVLNVAPPVGERAALLGVTITGGLSESTGGGIRNYGDLTIVDSIITNNQAGAAYSDGGGIVSSDTLTVIGSTLSDNTANMDGGAVAFRGKLTITNSLLVGNQASGAFGKGGAVSSSQGELTVTSSTIAGNSAGDDGGGLWLYTDLSTTTLRNSIIAGNTADGYGPDINTRVSADSMFNLVGNGNYMSGMSNGVGGNQVGSISAPIDPLFVDAAGGDYRLRGNSPAVDAGSNLYLDETDSDVAGPDAEIDLDDSGTIGDYTIAADLDGAARIVDGDLDGAATVHLGAFETSFEWDFGDAPTSYGTVAADGGAKHVTTGPQLGIGRDRESYGQPGALADGDDNNDADDEDGVSFGAIQVGQLNAIAIVTVQNAPAGAKLDAWIDFNGDGCWGGPGEQIADSVAVTDGDTTVAFDVPSWASAGDSYARFRLSTAGGLAPTGAAADGEVEDYRVTVAGPAEASGMFVPRTPLAQECDGPTDVFSVDLDDDGDMDVLTAIYSDNKIAWSENNGTGNFVTHTITTSAMSVMSVFAADVDGDGDMDVLSACQADSSIAWYENDGAESYTAHTITTSADVAQSVYAADVDGDGDMDVLSASAYDDKIAWYENDGSENFSAHTITAEADYAVSVFAADVDGDGDMDVLSASVQDDKIAWYENDGAENFTAHTITTAANGARSVLAADVDGDGDTDVLSASCVDDKVAWYENNGDETFTTRVITTTADYATDVQAEDVDGDGDMDVLSASQTDSKIAWYENDGDESFTAHAIATWPDYAMSVFAADLDGDGDMDVVSAAKDDAVAWHENDGAESFTTHTLLMPATQAQSVFTADMDGDGDMDVLSASGYHATIAWYENNGDEWFTPHTIATTSRGAHSVFAADVDGDGDLDVVSASVIDEKLSWYENDGVQSFTDHTIDTFVDRPESVFVADLDGDGDLDVLSASMDDDKINWYENDGVGAFTRQTITTSANGARSVFATDVDGDGDMDVLSASASDDKIAWYENDGAENFTERAIASTADAAASVFAADVDGDGDMDVLSASWADDKISWYENDGFENFTAYTISTMADGAYSVFAADVDGDGDLDVLSASTRDDKIAWYENDGAENFAAHTITSSADQAESVFVADVDGDGDLDVLSASSRDDKIAWYENLGYDYGDAPAPYPTLRADDGARHTQTGPTLGAGRDSETDGQPTALADGDDLAGPFNDEDGLVNASLLVRGKADAFLDVEISSLGYLNAWIDFDANGVWDTNEQIAIDMPATAGINRVPFAVPPGEPTDTYLRLRLTSYSTAGALTPAGPADDGEVEDHLVTIRDVIHLNATSGDDAITVWPAEPNLSGTVHAVDINGTLWTFDADVVGGIFVHGLAGNDKITTHGTSADETGTLYVGNVSLETTTYGVFADGIETFSIDAGMGNDQVAMTGSTASNRLYSYPGYSRMRDSSGTYSYRVDGFETVNIDVPAGGRNYAFLYDSSLNDVLNATPASVVFDRMLDTADETTTTISGFERVYAYATSGGTDRATLAGDDATANRFYGYSNHSILTESRRSFYYYARGFENVTVQSPGANTSYAYLYDSPGNDALTATATSAAMDRAAPWADTTANGFSRLYAYSTGGGTDSAELTGSSADGNQYRGYPTYSTLTDRLRSFYHYARGFDSVLAIGSEIDPSSDRACLYDSPGDDTLYGRGNQCYLEDTTGTAYHNETLYFDCIYARSTDDDATTNDTVDVDDIAYFLLKYGSWL